MKAKNAELIMLYAQDVQKESNPWTLWEQRTFWLIVKEIRTDKVKKRCYVEDVPPYTQFRDWETCKRQPNFEANDSIYRRKVNF